MTVVLVSTHEPDEACRGNRPQHPGGLAKALKADPEARSAWESITPLARNEWICWVEDAKKAETRTRRLGRAIEELADGKRRPCCWMGASTARTRR